MKDIELARKMGAKRTCVRVGTVVFGDNFVVIAGPCSVENETQMLQAARAVKQAGGHMLRGGAYKPRSSPYAFQGLGVEGLRIIAETGRQIGMPVITEVLDTRDVPLVSEYADMLQIGSRNMQNFALLREVGRSRRPVLLKRGMHSTLHEWLMAAEYILAEGNPNVVLCERGIRSVETYTRNTLDLNAVPALRELTHLPVVVDPSHGCGRASLVGPMALAAIAAGADGLMIEVHPQPELALSDRDQTLSLERFDALMPQIRAVRELMIRINNNSGE